MGNPSGVKWLPTGRVYFEFLQRGSAAPFEWNCHRVENAVLKLLEIKTNANASFTRTLLEH